MKKRVLLLSDDEAERALSWYQTLGDEGRVEDEDDDLARKIAETFNLRLESA